MAIAKVAGRERAAMPIAKVAGHERAAMAISGVPGVILTPMATAMEPRLLHGDDGIGYRARVRIRGCRTR
jgi:hypothetical protein